MDNQETSPQASNASASVSSQQPKNNNSRNRILIVVGVLILIAAAGLLGYKLGGNQEDDSASETKISSLESQISKLKSDLKSKDKNQPTAVADSAKPVIVYEPPGLFTDADKAELKKKLTDPVTDYYQGKVVSITIEQNSPQKYVIGGGDDKYLVQVIGTEGSLEGFLYGSKKSGVDWWAPSCLNGCEFTQEFKSKYPEVVSKSS